MWALILSLNEPCLLLKFSFSHPSNINNSQGITSLSHFQWASEVSVRHTNLDHANWQLQHKQRIETLTPTQGIPRYYGIKNSWMQNTKRKNIFDEMKKLIREPAELSTQRNEGTENFLMVCAMKYTNGYPEFYALPSALDLWMNDLSSPR